MTRTLLSPDSGLPEISLWQRALSVLRAGVVGAAAVTVLGLGVHYIAEDAAFEVHEVRFVGAERTSPVALRHLADLRTGEHLASADLGHTVVNIERHPWVSSARARRVFPSTVEIELVEHEPVLLLAVDGLWYLDAAGQPFRRARTDDLDYPVLTGLSPELVEQHPGLAAAASRAALATLAAAEAEGVLSSADISELNLDLERGFTVVLRSGSELVLGWTDPSERFVRVAQMVDAGLDLDTPHRVDLGSQALAIATPLSG